MIGELRRWQPDQAVERIEAEGGRTVDRVTESLDYLILGELNPRKSTDPHDQAKDFNARGAKIAMLDEAQFSELFSPSKEEMLAVLLSRPERERWEWLRGGYNRIIPMPDCAGLQLQNADLGGAPGAHSGLDLQCINLTGADLSGANLRGAGFDLRNGKLDGACLVDSSPRIVTNSSLKRVDLRGANLNTANLDGCDITEARLSEIRSPWWSAVRAIFHAADLSKCWFEQCSFQGADFSAAMLQGADLSGSDLTGCNLTGANLTSADLTGAKLTGANLSKAILHDANLACVDLTDAMIKDADFTNANLSGASLDGVDVPQAMSFPVDQKTAGVVGPNLRKLAEVTSQTKDLQILTQSTWKEGVLQIQLHAGAFGANGYQGISGVSGRADNNASYPFPRKCDTVEKVLTYLAHKWHGAQLNPASIKVKIKKCPLNAKELKTLAIAAYREVFAE
jgi:uncharacterized protein YjbI with pentapeptide repeats